MALILGFLLIQVPYKLLAQDSFIEKNKVHWGFSNSYPIVLNFLHASLPLPSSEVKGLMKENFFSFMVQRLSNQQLEVNYVNSNDILISFNFGPRFYHLTRMNSPFYSESKLSYITSQTSYVLSSNISKVLYFKTDRALTLGGGINYIPYHTNAYLMNRHYSVFLEGKHAFGYHLSASTLKKFRNNEKNLIGLHVRYEHLIPSNDFKEQALRYNPNTLGLHTIQVGLKYMRNTAKKHSEQ